MFDMKFNDGSEAEFSELSGVTVPIKFREEGFQADSLEVMLWNLDSGSNYRVVKYDKVVKVDKTDAVFIRLFVEDNFIATEFIGDVPEVPFQNTRSPFIVE
jgi:hypothetical protein